MSEIWLVTGCSSGIGKEIALAALAAGHRVAVTARDIARVEEFTGSHGDQALPLALDVTKPASIEAAVAAVTDRWGPVEILVNNAGYGYVAAVEEGEDHEIREMFETNFFGALGMIRAVLPSMREKRSGFIINISSQAGLMSRPGTAYYSSSKFALEGLTEGLSFELAPFGIRVTAVAPGAFRTDWSGRSMKRTKTPIDDYAATVGARIDMIKSIDQKQPGDPAKAAAEVIKLSRLAAPPLHLILGADVMGAYDAKLAGLHAEIEEWRPVSMSTGFDSA